MFLQFPSNFPDENLTVDICNKSSHLESSLQIFLMNFSFKCNFMARESRFPLRGNGLKNTLLHVTRMLDSALLRWVTFSFRPALLLLLIDLYSVNKSLLNTCSVLSTVLSVEDTESKQTRQQAILMELTFFWERQTINTWTSKSRSFSCG